MQRKYRYGKGCDHSRKMALVPVVGVYFQALNTTAYCGSHRCPISALTQETPGQHVRKPASAQSQATHLGGAGVSCFS